MMVCPENERTVDLERERVVVVESLGTSGFRYSIDGGRAAAGGSRGVIEIQVWVVVSSAMK